MRGKLAMQETTVRQGEAAAAHPGMHRLWDFQEADLGDWTAPEIRAGIEATAAQTSPEQGVGIRVAGLITYQPDSSCR